MAKSSGCPLSKVYPEWFEKVELLGEPGGYSIHAPQHLLTLEINDSAAAVWQMCSREFSVQDIIDVLVEAYHQQPAEIAQDVLQILNGFAEHKLVRFWRDHYQHTTPLNSGIEYHAVPRELLDALDSYRHAVEKLFPQVQENDQAKSCVNETLDKARQAGAVRAREKKHVELMFTHQDILGFHVQQIEVELDQLFPSYGVSRKNSGQMLYGGNSGMGWHTNEDVPGRRIYCNWSEKDNENAFLYQDPESGEIITCSEPAGWSLKSFYIPAPPAQLWHCVQAGGKRIALGFVEKQYQQVERLAINNPD